MMGALRYKVSPGETIMVKHGALSKSHVYKLLRSKDARVRRAAFTLLETSNPRLRRNSELFIEITRFIWDANPSYDVYREFTKRHFQARYKVHELIGARLNKSNRAPPRRSSPATRVVVRADFSSDCFCAHLAVKVGRLGCLKPRRGACSSGRVKALARVTRRTRYPPTTRTRADEVCWYSFALRCGCYATVRRDLIIRWTYST